jgi:hypothetical protein
MALKFAYFGKWIRKYLESFEIWCWGRMEKIEISGFRRVLKN